MPCGTLPFLLDIDVTEACVSGFGFKVAELAPGRDLPAETGLLGNVVLRFGGVSRGKSGGTTSSWGRELRPFNGPVDKEAVVGDGDGNKWRRVGVEGREGDREDEGCEFAGLQVGLDCLLLSAGEGALEGVEGRNGVEDLIADGEPIMGEDGLFLRMDEDLFEELVLSIELEMVGRLTELLLVAGLD